MLIVCRSKMQERQYRTSTYSLTTGPDADCGGGGTSRCYHAARLCVITNDVSHIIDELELSEEVHGKMGDTPDASKRSAIAVVRSAKSWKRLSEGSGRIVVRRLVTSTVVAPLSPVSHLFQHVVSLLRVCVCCMHAPL